MDRTLFRYDEPYYTRPRRKANLFAWTIAILLLIGATFAAWLGSYYVFNQPERPESYRILKKLHKVEQPKRFQLTAAPPGEFLDPKKLHDRYATMGPAELAKANGELARNYIRNYQAIHGLVPYVVGRFTIMDARELGPNDLFTSGMVALTDAVEFGEVLMEHVYPADADAVPLMKETLVPGLEMKLERAHDLSAIVHVDRLADGRLLATVVPLLYGNYTVTQGRGAFSLEPPLDLNMAAGFPLFKTDQRKAAENRFAVLRQKIAVPNAGLSVPGIGPSPQSSTPTNALVRVEEAIPLQPTATPAPSVAPIKGTKGKIAKNQKASPSPSAVAKASATATPIAVAAASPELVRPSSPATTSAATTPAVPMPTATPGIQPLSGDTALASTAGGGTWKTYPAGKMPVGRLITTTDLGDLADRGMAGERVYLRGQFVVNFAESNRAVLRPKGNMAETVLHFGAPSSTRIIVEFPQGYTPPPQGSTVTRDQTRPYEVTEVRKQADGQLNVFVREIMQ